MITALDLKHLHLAEIMATYSDYDRVHIGACVINKRKVISTGCNQNKTHPLQKQFNENNLNYIKRNGHKLHAEMDALIKAGSNSKGSTLYIFRRGNDGIYRICEPCKACMSYIKQCGIKRIVYTIENGIVEKLVN